MFTPVEEIEKYSEAQRGFKDQCLVWWNKQNYIPLVYHFCRNLLCHNYRRKVSDSWLSMEGTVMCSVTRAIDLTISASTDCIMTTSTLKDLLLNEKPKQDNKNLGTALSFSIA